jgi:4-amino-4-deoxy-L-arabinose transferase-like glycosyltransferase
VVSYTQRERSRVTTNAALTAILALASLLRLWGVEYGLPHPVSRPDEELVVGRAHSLFANGGWDPGSLVYPSLVIYLATGAIFLYYALGNILGHYDQRFDLLFEIAVVHPGLDFWICRWVSVVAGVATVLAVYSVGFQAYERRASALLAAAALAVNPIHVRDSHFATVDITMTLFVTLSLAFAIRACRDASFLHFGLAGLFAGLAMSAKYNGALVFVGVLVAAFQARERGPKWSPAVKRFLAACATMALAFALTSPYVFLRFGRFLDSIAKLKEILYTSRSGSTALWEYLGETLPLGLGWPLLAAACWGAARAVRRRGASDVALLAAGVALLGWAATLHFSLPRYVLPLVPVLLVLASEAPWSAVGRLSGRRTRTIAGTLLVALMLAPGFADAVRFDRLAAEKDTRVQASEWIAQNVPRRTTLAVCRGYGAPALNEDRRRPPAFVVVELDCFQAPEQIPREASFLITHEHAQLSNFSRVHPELAAWLQANASPVARFDPNRVGSEGEPLFHGADAFYLPFSGFEAVERGGPKVTIWKLPAEGGRRSERAEPR